MLYTMRKPNRDGAALFWELFGTYLNFAQKNPLPLLGRLCICTTPPRCVLTLRVGIALMSFNQYDYSYITHGHRADKNLNLRVKRH